MSDEFRKQMDSECCWCSVKCPHCNDYKVKGQQPKLRRLIRRRDKLKLKKDISEGTA